ncbi:MAG: zf-HC2 domain-containing protein, partial [Gemmatimonadota bacterium]|nr:zf-HC2 domain-containing protein [Gemmatimonadota bacterium]
MQHPDEGLIHSWLDGQLPAAEAALLESHVVECHACAEKVAEARGLIAGSSRILTALDDAPRGVIPAAPRTSRQIPFLKAAAVLLVVATGGMLVLRGGRSESPAIIVNSTAATTPASVAPVTGNAPVAAAQTSKAPAAATVSHSVAAQPSAPLSVQAGDKTVAVAATSTKSPAAGALGQDTTIDIVMTPERLQLSAVVTTGVTSVNAQSNLKLVGDEPVPGGRRTTYEVEPGKLVSLVEANPVITGSAMSARSTAIQSRGVYAPRSTVSSTPTAMTMEADPSTLQIIRWTDKATGSVMTLTGPFSEEKLEQIRR